jgi:GR25 family glycosyltransferase involved in LPS biosynthesis
MEIKHYWINTDKSLHRKSFMELQFKLSGIDNQRINAITPETLSHVLIDKPPFDCGNPCCKYMNCRDCPFEYACTCSHLEAIKRGFLSNAPYFVVCEDDIYFPFKINYDSLIKKLPDDWDILQMMVLDTDKYDDLFSNHYKKNNQLFIKFEPYKQLFSTGMYLISHQGAAKLLHIYTNQESGKFELNKIPVIKQADFIIYMSVNTYTTTIPFCMPYLRFISDIHPHHFNIHKLSIEKIINVLNDMNENYQNPLINDIITHRFNFNDFDNFFVSLLQESK